ncbi:MAG: hypothetical protein AAF770_03360 [Bacteroidota bacterium]
MTIFFYDGFLPFWARKTAQRLLNSIYLGHHQAINSSARHLYLTRKNSQSFASTSASCYLAKVIAGIFGTYEPTTGLLDLRGSYTAQIASDHLFKDSNDHLDKQESQASFISVEEILKAIKKYQKAIRVIDLSHNAIDLFNARKILEVARECPHIEKLILKENILMAHHRMTRFFDYDLNLFLKKNSVKEVNIEGNRLATQIQWRNLFRKNYGRYVDAKLVTQKGEKLQQLPYQEGVLGMLWFYFFS